MTAKPTLEEIFTDAHAFFFLLTGEEAMRLKLWEIGPEEIVIDRPKNAPMRKTILGYIPTLRGDGIYEIEGMVNMEEKPDQMPNTVRVRIDPMSVRKVNRRQYPRYSFTPPIDVAICEDGSGRVTSGRMINLSAGGLRIESAEEITADHPLVFTFEIELDEEVHELAKMGQVVYELPEGDHHTYGVKFTNPGDEDALVKDGEAPIQSIDATIDLMNLVNRLLVREE